MTTALIVVGAVVGYFVGWMLISVGLYRFSWDDAEDAVMFGAIWPALVVCAVVVGPLVLFGRFVKMVLDR